MPAPKANIALNVGKTMRAIKNMATQSHIAGMNTESFNSPASSRKIDFINRIMCIV